MTVVEAARAFEAAKLAAATEDTKMSAANAAVEVADRDVKFGAPARAEQVKIDAANALQRAQEAAQRQFDASSAAHQAVSDAWTALNDAVKATFQGGPTERV